MIEKIGTGFVIKNTSISVDYFKRRDNEHLQYRFLTHAHADHTRLITSTWKNATIYCSHLTKSLLIEQYRIKNEFIVGLDLNKKYTFTMKNNKKFRVTLIDANHCPGAVMYLFESDSFGTILTTGDFRYSPRMFSYRSPLRSCVNKIDLCHFDNWNNNSKFNNIPSRINAYYQIYDLVKKKINENENTIFELEMDNLGKEEILSNLAEHFNTKVAVSYARFHRLTQILGYEKKYFTTDIKESNPMFYVKNDSNSFHRHSKHMNLIKIVPSGFKIQRKFRMQNFYEINYTDHSSLNDLHMFIKRLKPKCLIGQQDKRVELGQTIDITDYSRFLKYLNSNLI